MRLSEPMLKVLKMLHDSKNQIGNASFRTAFALSDRELVLICKGGFPARTQGGAFPELSVELTEKGRAYCISRFGVSLSSFSS